MISIGGNRYVSICLGLISSLFLIPSVGSHAAEIKAKSVSLSDVSRAIGSAHDNDIVSVPAGTAEWTAGLTVGKGITLQGAGAEKTVIVDGVTGAKSVIEFSPDRFFRMTGFTIQRQTPLNKSGHYIVHVKDSCPIFRIDHCDFKNLPGRSIFVNAERGVIDHNTFEMVSGGSFGVLIHHGNWGGGGKFGDKSWAAPLGLGSDHAIFIEDNTFTNNAQGVRAVTDGYAGARFVLRHNTLIDTYSSCHGTESTGRFRGTRSWEIYQNTFKLVNIRNYQNCTFFRSGTGVIWGNTATGGYERFSTMVNYRDTSATKMWGGADGTNPWDLNDPKVYASGTYRGTSGSQMLSMADAAWKPDQWLKYTLRNLTQNRFSVIISNTATTIKYKTNTPKAGPMTFNTGDHFEIRKVLHALDHPGASTSDLLIGAAAMPHWLNQKIEPIYFWDNTLNGAPGTIVSRYNIIEGKDYIMGSPKPGYKPYQYPHPLVTGTENSKQTK